MDNNLFIINLGGNADLPSLFRDEEGFFYFKNNYYKYGGNNMLDLKFVRENPEIVKQNIKNKFQDNKLGFSR